MSVAKAYGVLFYNRKFIFEVIKRLERLFPKSIEEQTKHKIRFFCVDLKKKTFGFIFLNIWGVGIYLISPLASQIYGIVFQGYEFQKVFPTIMFFWFDPFQPVIYESLYIFISWLSFTLSITILATDLLFCSILSLISIQFKILKQHIREIDGGKALEKLKAQIKIHQELIAISDLVEKIFSPSFLLSVFSSSLVICFTGFQVAVSLS